MTDYLLAAGSPSSVTVTGRGAVSYVPALADPPAGMPPALRRHSETYPAPGLARFGWPETWLPVDEVDEIVGRPQIVVGGKDVTFFRGVPCAAPQWTETEPFGDASAVLRFPQISPFEELGTGDLAWLKDWAPVEIAFILANGTREVRFEGSLGSFEDTVDTDSGRLELHCIGALYRADLYVKEPAFSTSDLLDLGRRIPDLLNRLVTTKALPLAVCGKVSSSILSRDGGSWNPVLTGFIQDLIGNAYLEDGRQLTVMLRRPRKPSIRWKDTDTIAWTVAVGARGVETDLSRDLSMAPNVIYGEGTDPNGCHWRNSRYPNLHPDTAPAYPLTLPGVFSPGDEDTGFAVFATELRDNGYPMVSGDTYAAADEGSVRAFQSAAGITVDGVVGPQTWAAAFETGSNAGDLAGAYFAPLAIDPRVEPFRYNAQGAVIGKNPAFDPHVARVEKFENFGDRVTKAEAVKSAKRELARLADPGYTGTVTLTSDPQEGSRFRAVRAGSNGRVRFHRGVDRKLHVAQVDYDLESGVVTARVDEHARDAMTLSAVRGRNRETRDPANRQKPTYRNSKLTEDRVAIFDCENGSGIIPRGFAVFGGLWSVLRIPTAGRGRIVKIEMTTSGPATAFSVAVLAKPITANELASLIGNPLAYKVIDGRNTNPWDTFPENRLLINAWGSPDEASGYYPHPQTNSDGSTNPVTGKMVDTQEWYFESTKPPWLWVAVYAPVSCHVEGRLFAGVDTG